MEVKKNHLAVLAIAEKSTGMCRYAIQGVQMVSTGSKSELVATDGRRLLMVQYPDVSGRTENAGKNADNPGTLVPPHVIQALKKRLGSKAKARFNGSEFDCGSEGKVNADPQDGIFPKYAQLIPKDNDGYSIRVNAKIFGELLAAMANVLDSDTPYVEMQFHKDKNKPFTITGYAIGRDLKVQAVQMPVGGQEDHAKRAECFEAALEKAALEAKESEVPPVQPVA